MLLAGNALLHLIIRHTEARLRGGGAASLLLRVSRSFDMTGLSCVMRHALN